ncbi:MAG: hydroxyquinol 1,2-dioxygenase [Actinomycetia bacterium]|nr:hydroxyquinol 1,2-dioxygenase [Actinomycetes bacterium]
MTTKYVTKFGSLENYEKGGIEIIDDDPKHFVFSNIFEVANSSKPWEKVAVAKNTKYVIEGVRAEGTSEWRTCAHDEFVTVLDGEVKVEFVKLATPAVPADKEGSVALGGEPTGTPMGHVVLRRGHQALLPANAAYRFTANRTGVLIQQAIHGDDTVERWADICLS